jgi:hydroxymethylpyrimidine/phosphomethylpyrimidine kinase
MYLTFMDYFNAGVMVDVLYDGQEFTHITGPLVQTENVHGTGCTLSTAIACELAKGLTVLQARIQHPHSYFD